MLHRMVHRLGFIALFGPSERLKICEWIVAPMHRGHEPPFLGGPALAHDPPHRVAGGAGLLDVGVLVRLVIRPALGLERGWTGFFGSQAKVVGQVPDDLTRRLRGDRQIIQHHHPADGLLPALRRGTPKRDARQLAVIVRPMTRTTRLSHRGVRDRDARLRRGICRLSRHGRRGNGRERQTDSCR